jgi:elongator complex protein 3
MFALLRLRKPSGQKFSQFNSVLHNSALIREVHSYGGEVSVGEEGGVGQHRGLGKKLIAEAERIARDEWSFSKITVIAGVGTREYYRKFGYKEKCTYMVKVI